MKQRRSALVKATDHAPAPYSVRPKKDDFVDAGDVEMANEQ